MSEKGIANILIVDDRPENLLALERLLEGPGIHIIRAASGNEALGLVLDHDFALVLLDVQMPQMDGFETAELMRGNASTRHIPIIFVTAISKEQKYVFKGYESGAVDYLFKPLDTHVLQSKVNIFIEMHRQKKALERSNRELETAHRETEAANHQLTEKNQLISSQKKQLSDALAKVETSYQVLQKSQKRLLELERKNSILAMAVTANHELNQPLTVIKGYIGMVENTLNPTQLTKKQRKYFEKIEQSFERIDIILRNFNETASVSIENYDATKKMFVFGESENKEE
ncbi:MAG: response regulator [bacterium]|nr:response regulator [bacterium]